MYNVIAIGEKPVENFEGKELYLNCFGAVEELGMEPLRKDSLHLLELLNWWACVIRF